MHIAIATMEFVTEKAFSGGLANYSANLARILRKRGNQVSVFVISMFDEELDWEDGIKVYRVRYFDFFEKIKKLKVKCVQRGMYALWDLFGASLVINLKIHQVSKKSEVDIVHFCSSGSLPLFRSRKIPAVARCSTYLPAARCARMQVFEYEKMDKLNLTERVQLKALQRVKYIFAPSYNVAKLTENKVKRKVYVIESPFCMDISHRDDSLYNCYLKSKKYFIFYGGLQYLKGVHTIACTLNDFFANYPECYFVFIGNNAKMVYQEQKVDAIEYVYRNVKNQYHSNILYFPAMSNKKQLYSFIEHAEACVLPSRFDNLPNTCVESMALGQIVIGTSGASFEQLIEDGYNGYLIERENASQLYQKMELILRLSEEEKEKIKKRAKESISRLEPDKIYDQIMNFYKVAIQQKKTSRNKKECVE